MTFRKGIKIRANIRPREERTYNSRTYHSRAEMRYAARLDLELKAGTLVRWEPQYKFTMGTPHPDCRRCFWDKPTVYVADFAVWRSNPFGDWPDEVHEVKGWAAAPWKRKARLFMLFYPGVKLVVIDAETIK